MFYYPLVEMCQNLYQFSKHHCGNPDLLDSDYDFIKNLEAMAFDYLSYHNIREEKLHSFSSNFNSERLKDNVELNHSDCYYNDPEQNYDLNERYETNYDHDYCADNTQGENDYYRNDGYDNYENDGTTYSEGEDDYYQECDYDDYEYDNDDTNEAGPYLNVTRYRDGRQPQFNISKYPTSSISEDKYKY